MKRLLLSIFFSVVIIQTGICVNYPTPFTEEEYGPRVITDKIEWKFFREIASGTISNCTHEWVYSRTWQAGSSPSRFPPDENNILGYFGGSISCLVNHNGFHCDWTDKVRNQICKYCGRIEQWRENYIQHVDQRERPKSEYEILESCFSVIQ